MTGSALQSAPTDDVPPEATPGTGSATGSGPFPRPEPARGRSPVMVLLVLVATIGILAYAAFLLDPANRGDLIPYFMVIVAETILVAHALFAMWTILSGGDDPRDFAFHRAQDDLLGRDPSHPDRPDVDAPVRIDGREVLVDVFITVYGEELDKVRATAEAAMRLRGRHRTWILDDGRSDDVRALADELGCWYIRRLSSGGAKAGNLNHALSVAKGEFFAVFDADFVPHPDFLIETLPFFVDPKVAFVQTPQAYGNLDTTIARGAAYMQAVFYRFIQPGRNRFNAAFCVGTNVAFRRDAVLDVGGICSVHGRGRGGRRGRGGGRRGCVCRGPRGTARGGAAAGVRGRDADDAARRGRRAADEPVVLGARVRR